MVDPIDFQKFRGGELGLEKVKENLINEIGKSMFEADHFLFDCEDLSAELFWIDSYLNYDVPRGIRQIHTEASQPPTRDDWKEYCRAKKEERKEQELLQKLSDVLQIVQKKLDEDVALENIYHYEYKVLSKRDLMMQKLEGAEVQMCDAKERCASAAYYFEQAKDEYAMAFADITESQNHYLATVENLLEAEKDVADFTIRKVQVGSATGS